MIATSTVKTSGDVDKGCLHPRASSPTSVHCLHRSRRQIDASTSVMLSWPLPHQSAARTPQRLRRHRVPLPQQQAGMTPQRRTKTILRKLHPSECTEPANSYTFHDPSRCSGPVGGTRKRWLAEEVDGLDPQYCRPGGPAIANHLTRHDAHDHVSRRLDASDAGNQSHRTSNVQRDT